ncbi:MAG: NADH-quinone oxidoreductase subunit N [Gemmataceae bacterium]
MKPPLTPIQTDYLTAAVQFVIPEVALVGVACGLFLLGLWVPKRVVALVVGLAGIGLAAALAAAPSVGGAEVGTFWATAGDAPYPRALAAFDPTGAAAFVRWLSLGTAAVLLLACWRETTDDTAADYAACFLVVAAGTALVGRANDLVSLFLALEMVSIPTYVLLYLPARGRPGQEAGVKYFLLSVLSSAVLLFGFSYLYGLTGATNLAAVTDTLTDAHKQGVSPLALIAAVMVIAGLGFRITAVPFHFYAPDVYEGGPTGVVAQLAVIPKIAGFVALARVLGLLTPPAADLPFDAATTLIPLTLWVLAAVTMTFGNVLALLQTNLKRLLAYSGIAHAGYMLIGVLVACSLPDAKAAGMAQLGMDSVLFYLVAYGLMTAGAFAVLLYLGDGVDSADDLSGLGQSHPLAAGLMAVFLLSLIGLPLTAGFMGKFLLFVGAFNAPTVPPMGNMYRVLAVIAAVNAAVGAVYYLRLLGVMYQRPAGERVTGGRSGPALAAAIVCAVGTLALGVYPKPLAEAAKAAVPVTDSRPASTPR